MEFSLAIIELYGFASISALKGEKKPKVLLICIDVRLVSEQASDTKPKYGRLLKTVFVEKSVKDLSWFLLKNLFLQNWYNSTACNLYQIHHC